MYYRNFCDKFAATFIPGFNERIKKQRRISAAGTQQLLLDVYNLKKLMLDLPRQGMAEDAQFTVPQSYRKYVDKHMTKVQRPRPACATWIIPLARQRLNARLLETDSRVPPGCPSD